MLKHLAGTAIAAAALIAAAAIAPAAAGAAPARIAPGSEVIVVHTDGEPTVARADGVTRYPDNHPASPDGDQCTLGHVFQGQDGEPRALIAAHCGDVHEEIFTANGRLIGRIAAAADYSDSNDNSPDTALVSFAPGVNVDSQIAESGPLAGTISPEDIKRTEPVLCKFGAKTGVTCGPIAHGSGAPAGMIAFQAENEHGDSGSPVWTYGKSGEVLAVGTFFGSPQGRSDIAYVEPLGQYLQDWKLH